MRVVGYIRVSTDDQELSPDAQRSALQRWCESNGHELVEVFADIAKKGHHGEFDPDKGLDLQRRPALMAALNAVKDADIFLVIKRDRLARSVMLSAIVDKLVEKAGAKVMTVQGVGNGDSIEERMLRQIMDVFAEYERGLISMRTRAAMAVLKDRGRYTGGRVPYGFRRTEDGGLVEAPDEMAVIDEVVSLSATGRSLRGIAAELTNAGYRSRTGRPFQAIQIKNILEKASAA